MTQRPFAQLNNMIHEKKGDVAVAKPTPKSARDAMQKIATSKKTEPPNAG